MKGMSRMEISSVKDICTDFSGDKLMDRYQEKTGIFTEYCDICDMWDCMEYQQ